VKVPPPAFVPIAGIPAVCVCAHVLEHRVESKHSHDHTDTLVCDRTLNKPSSCVCHLTAGFYLISDKIKHGGCGEPYNLEVGVRALPCVSHTLL
jgi:hypothetical protein